jgi:acyl-CoA reductase-like NAD-dependent aldehyde dehydrogenase
VFGIAQGARAVSEAVIDSVDFIQFTEPTATGRKVMERAARRLTQVSLKRGKNPMVGYSPEAGAPLGGAASACPPCWSTLTTRWRA